VRRVSVIGTSSGAGKTTLGQRLARRLDVPFVELDALFWGPGWTQARTEDFRGRVTQIADQESWVIDGNYTGRLGDLVWRRADAVVWLDLPLAVSLWRTLRRTIERARSGEELWSGNRETLRNAFLARDSLFVYAIRSHRRRRRLFEERLASGRYSHLEIHRFRSANAANAWLASM
jgi:adenylate kinase family enzyme